MNENEAETDVKRYNNPSVYNCQRMQIRDLFKAIADSKPQDQRRPYYELIRSILHDQGNKPASEVVEDLFTEREAALYAEIKTMANIDQRQMDIEQPMDAIHIVIGTRVFTCQVPRAYEDRVELTFDGITVSVGRA